MTLIEMVQEAEAKNYSPAPKAGTRGKGAFVLTTCPHCGGNRKSRMLFVSNRKRATKKFPAKVWKCHVCGKGQIDK